MLVLPIPLITSLALGFLLLRALLAGRRVWPIPALLAACAAQGVVIALAQYYAVPAMRFVQPVTATVIPPLAWLAFRTTALRPFDPPRDCLHLGIPAFTAFCVAFAPQTLDGVVSGIFIVYGLVMLHALRAGADALPLIRLESGDWPPRIWRIMAVLLILSALGDGVIAAAQMLGKAWLQPWIVSMVSSPVAPPDRRPQSVEKPGGGRGDSGARRAGAVARGGRTGHRDHGPPGRGPGGPGSFLDPGLTLSRLARRLGLPAKQLSAAINRATGQNVSRYSIGPKNGSIFRIGSDAVRKSLSIVRR